MEARNLTQTARSDNKLHSVLGDAKVDPKDCYQCGKCSAGCPVASDADMTPREVLRHLQLRQVEPVLKSNMPWLCAGCGMCLVRSARNRAHRRGRSFQPAVYQRRTRKGTLGRSRPSHAFQPYNGPFPAGCIECTENGGARNDRPNQQGTGECR